MKKDFLRDVELGRAIMKSIKARYDNPKPVVIKNAFKVIKRRKRVRVFDGMSLLRKTKTMTRVHPKILTTPKVKEDKV